MSARCHDRSGSAPHSKVRRGQGSRQLVHCRSSRDRPPYVDLIGGGRVLTLPARSALNCTLPFQSCRRCEGPHLPVVVIVAWKIGILVWVARSASALLSMTRWDVGSRRKTYFSRGRALAYYATCRSAWAARWSATRLIRIGVERRCFELDPWTRGVRCAERAHVGKPRIDIVKTLRCKCSGLSNLVEAS